MTNVTTITDFRNNIGTYIDHVIYKNEEVILKKGNKIVAKVIAYTDSPIKVKKEHPLMKLAGLLSDKEAGEMKKMLKDINEESKKDTDKTIKSFLK